MGMRLLILVTVASAIILPTSQDSCVECDIYNQCSICVNICSESHENVSYFDSCQDKDCDPSQNGTCLQAYSESECLEKCCEPRDDPVQFNSLSLKQCTEKINSKLIRIIVILIIVFCFLCYFCGGLLCLVKSNPDHDVSRLTMKIWHGLCCCGCCRAMKCCCWQEPERDYGSAQIRMNVVSNNDSQLMMVKNGNGWLEEKSSLALTKINEVMMDSSVHCAICLDSLPPVLTQCLHSFHLDCLRVWRKKNNWCPVCIHQGIENVKVFCQECLVNYQPVSLSRSEANETSLRCCRSCEKEGEKRTMMERTEIE